MIPFEVKKAAKLKFSFQPPGDKSIAHRAVILSALSEGKTAIKNFPFNEDCFATVNVFKELGIRFKQDSKKNLLIVFGNGLLGLAKPKKPIFISQSGTTYRLSLGVLAGQSFVSKLIAGKGLSKRPMRRVIEPLRLMGAKISSKVKSQKSKIEEYPPLTIKGNILKGITFKPAVASAQVKSAILLAGIYAQGKTCIREKLKTRDHTERMLKAFGIKIKITGNMVCINPHEKLISPKNIYVPGDISSAAFFLVLAAICKNSQVTVNKVSLNPTRAGIVNVLKRMGAKIKIKRYATVKNIEPIADITVKSSKLKPVVIKNAEIPSLIDELPILMVAACFAEGKTIFEGVKELRVKETDRINSTVSNLRKMGVDIKVTKAKDNENIIINGKGHLSGASVKSFGDHRTAMSMVIAGLAAEGNSQIDDIKCIDKSFPNFINLLKEQL